MPKPPAVLPQQQHGNCCVPWECCLQAGFFPCLLLFPSSTSCSISLPRAAVRVTARVYSASACASPLVSRAKPCTPLGVMEQEEQGTACPRRALPAFIPLGNPSPVRTSCSVQMVGACPPFSCFWSDFSETGIWFCLEAQHMLSVWPGSVL